MKKLLTILVIATLAMASQAASFMWGGGKTISVIEEGGDVTLWNDYTGGYRPDAGYLALFYLGQTGSLLEMDDLTAGSAVHTIPTVVSTSAKKNNQISTGQYVFTTEYDPGATFQVFWVNEAGSLENIYALDGTTAFNEQLTVNDVSETATIPDLYAAGGGGGVDYAVHATPIPEPATAALAIAGLALLFRRRK